MNLAACKGFDGIFWGVGVLEMENESNEVIHYKYVY